MSNEGNKLLLGPIVGHTDTASSRVWIQVSGAPEAWTLRVEGGAVVRFEGTEAAGYEFGTAIATVMGLMPDTRYAYQVSGPSGEASGSFRTMPPNDSRETVKFATLSCNDDREPNAWQALQQYIEREEPRFLLMVGDQVYMDEVDEGSVWDLGLDSPRDTRRLAMVQKYDKLWAVEPARTILANIPTYMTWDDHDIRDGWGSFAGDSPTLAAQSEAAAQIHAPYRTYFEDAYDVYYHFQACRNPVPKLEGGSKSTPFAFRCGRLLVVVPDGRTDRDFARAECAILGAAQWSYLDSVVAGIDSDVDAIAVATSVPIVDLDPDGKVHRFFKDRTDDVDLMAKGDGEGLLALLSKSDSLAVALPSIVLGATVDREFRVAKALGFRVGDLDDVRDKWSYETNRAEQERLLRTFTKAATARSLPRGLSFFGGDIHVGAIFDVVVEGAMTFNCVVTSGIAKSAPLPEVRGVLVDGSFDVSPGIHAELQSVVNAVNFAATTVSFPAGAVGVFRSEIRHENKQAPEAL